MRIGMDVREFSTGTMTGIGRYLWNFLTYVRTYEPEHQIVLYGNQWTCFPISGPRVRWRVIPERITAWWDQVSLAYAVERDGIEVFFSPYVKGPVRVMCPLVTTIHDLLFLVYPEYATWKVVLKNAAFVQMARRVVRRADRVIVLSDYSWKEARALLGTSGDRMEVIPNAVDDVYRPVQEDRVLQRVQRRYGVRSPYILYVGNFKPHKNVQALIRAFAALPVSMQREYMLVLAGSDQVSSYRDLCRSLRVEDYVAFTGFVADEDLPVLYSGATLFVFPSLYEGFGLPPLEAMACGTPVLCSDRTSLPEVVGNAAVLFDPEDIEGLSKRIAALLASEERRSDLIGRGIERAHCFRVEEIGRRQLDLLKRARWAA